MQCFAPLYSQAHVVPPGVPACKTRVCEADVERPYSSHLRWLRARRERPRAPHRPGAAMNSRRPMLTGMCPSLCEGRLGKATIPRGEHAVSTFGEGGHASAFRLPRHVGVGLMALKAALCALRVRSLSRCRRNHEPPALTLSARRRHWRIHSIMSSARSKKSWLTVKPSVLAVLRLITSSNLIGAWTGKSAGFAPLRMRST